MKDSSMIPVSEARTVILDNVRELGPEIVALDDCLGRVLAEAVCARRNVPPTDNSAMDGFALTSAATEGASDGAPVALPDRIRGCFRSLPWSCRYGPCGQPSGPSRAG